jgi:predicted CXXCH cytochrome family protein
MNLIRITSANQSSPVEEYVGNAACARCHAEIYKSFQTTPMANSSGEMKSSGFQENLNASEFVHTRSGFTYRVNKKDDAWTLAFNRGPGEKSTDPVKGDRPMEYFIGSGNHGRGYAYSLNGYLYQLPIGYYSQAQKWDMSPGYEQGELMKLTRPIQQGCLECHASNLRPIAGTENRYESKPFLENGISCERCHGPGGRHAALMKTASGGEIKNPGIVNPSKLDPARRDSVCAQCHLSGEARIDRAGRSLLTYRPGDQLSDHVLSFLRPAATADTLSATGHVETLERSRCKQMSGDKLSCTSCHNPHSRPAPGAAVTFFNQKCTSCHQTAACKGDRKLRENAGDSCIGCHMPKRPTADIGHNVFTDHSIYRGGSKIKSSSGAPTSPGVDSQTLIPFRNAPATQRDLGMAYLSVASKSKGEYYARAAESLKRAEPTLDQDAAALTYLGKIYEREKDPARASRCYEKALKADPTKVEAGVDLGAIYARSGRLPEAIKLWEDVLQRNPGYEIARLNLAFAHLENGNFDVAKQTLLKALEYDPDLPVARKILNDLKSMR